MTRSSEAPHAGVRWFIAASLMLTALAAAGAPETNFRLAGIVGAGGQDSIALIELPDGRQRLYRTGEMLGEGRLREITAHGVRIELAGEDLLLRLRGNPRILSARVEAQADDQSDAEQYAESDDEGEPAQIATRTQQLSASETARLLASAQPASQSGASVQPQLAEGVRDRLNELLEIPADARIAEVNDVRVNTPQEAIEALASHLEQHREARLTVSGAGPLETIVLISDSEQ